MDRLLQNLEYNKIIDMLKKHASTKLGIGLIENLMPSFNFDAISKRLANTTEALLLIHRCLAPNFIGIHDITLSIKRAEIASTLSAEELVNIADTLRGSSSLKKYFKEARLDTPLLANSFSNLYTNNSICEQIYKCIDSSGNISDHASATLRKIRNEIKSLEAGIKKRIDSIIHGETYTKYLQENIVTIRNSRYVIPVRQEYRSFVPGLVHDSSATGSTLFIEPIEIVETNNKIHELSIAEKVEVEKILLELSSLVWNITNELKVTLKNIAYLDFSFAKASFALESNAFLPKLNKDSYINLKKARHPLIDKNLVVPTDIYIGKDFSSLVITGPNTGGKTVVLKTVGLLTLMAYSGLYIPASDSEIAIFDYIFTDIGDEQSIEQNLSTFSSHMTNIVYILNHVTPNSLVLLDELGSGTDPVEGSALAIAILKFLYEKGTCTISTTHYSELKTFALTTNGIENASCEFNIENLEPTYKLIIGLPGKSNAFAISKKLGLKEEVLSNAENFLTAENVEFEKILSELEKNRHLIETQKSETDKELKEISIIKEQVIKNKNELYEHKRKIIEEAKEEAKEILFSAEEIAKKSIREIKNAKNKSEAEMSKQFDETRKLIKEGLKNTQSIPLNYNKDYTPFEISVGMSVFIPMLNEEATILTMPDHDDMVFVQVGIVKSKINIKNIRQLKKASKKSGKVKIAFDINERTQNISGEISLRGLYSSEAIDVLDNYINDALLTGINSIRIIHGKGEGILKKAVHEYLKNNPHIKSFRLGKLGEGDLGVTIAEII